MPSKKLGRKNHSKGLGDVTLNDFANSSVPKNRQKKSSNNVNTVLKKEIEKEIEKTWDMKDDEEFDGDFVAQENEDGTISYTIQKVEPRARRKTISTSDYNAAKKNNSGHDYPIDIWYLLSEYIRVEDVGIFAAICKTSFEVTCSAKFWFSLYRRCYKSVPDLPEHLQPERLVRKYGLRVSVIRALQYMYDPFRMRIQYTRIHKNYKSVQGRYCCLLWHEVKSSWIYYFKMKKKVRNDLLHSRNKPEQPDLLEILDDVLANPDEDCQILMIACRHFVLIPPIIGLTLTSISLTFTSPPLSCCKVQLKFGSGINSTSKTTDGPDCVDIILDRVHTLKIRDWWHPSYPYSRTIGGLLNQD